MLQIGRTALLACFCCISSFGVLLAQTHPCLPCHAREVERFSKSPMGRSVSAFFDEPDGQFVHKNSGAHITIFRQSGILHHRVEERGISADYPIAYSIGYGKVGRSYLIQLGGHFFQSPAAFYTAHSEWNVSPGYESEQVLDFTRAIASDCLFCHADSVKTATGAASIAPISCQRCHGPSDNHLRRPVPGSIVNPARLPLRERDSVCEQCHLEGPATVLNPGKHWWDFHPGESLENVETHYIFRAKSGMLTAIAAVSQAEQLAQSACLRSSGGKLWCGTCHNPHGAPVNRRSEMKRICESCHASNQLALFHTNDQDDCVACHMPRRQASDIAHAAITDHRIAKRAEASRDTREAPALVAWHEPPRELAERNLGLAYFQMAKQTRSAEYFQRAFGMLSHMSYTKDAEVSAAMGYMLLGNGHANPAVQLFQIAAHQEPESAEYWLDLGVAQDAVGDTTGAIDSLKKSIEQNRYDFRPYKALANLYERLHDPRQAGAVGEQFLELVPQSITMRLDSTPR